MLWSKLKQQGTSRWVQSSYFWLFFVPVAAHLLSSVSDKATFDIGGRQLALTMSLPFNWKLFYFAAVSFSLAGFIYLILCPHLVRDYDSLSQFVDVGKGSQFLVRELTIPKIVDHIRTRDARHLDDVRHFIKTFTTGVKVDGMDFRRYRDETVDKSQPIIKVPDDRPGLPVEVIPEKLSEAFWFARNVADESHPYPRRFCTGLYIIGYAAFFWVSCQGFWYVLWSR